MSFSFNFGVEDLSEGSGIDAKPSAVVSEQEGRSDGVCASMERGPAKRHTLKEMIQSLPSKVSYSCTRVQSGTGKEVAVYRRDLFDARFQMIDEDVDEDDGAANDDSRWKEVMAGAASDLEPGVYEGGLKTWECSLDLVALLHSKAAEDEDLLTRFRKIAEIGCGTAYPSIYAITQVLQRRSSSPDRRHEALTFQLCDFNEQVLRLVTVPNVLLNWYFTVQAPNSVQSADEGELEISEELLTDFTKTLESCAVQFELYSGFWDGLQEAGAFSDPKPDLILTSETIYSLDTMPRLVTTLLEAANGRPDSPTLCLVAAKVIYFGVGGGVYAFEQELKRRGAQCPTIWKSDAGVARVILQVLQQ